MGERRMESWVDWMRLTLVSSESRMLLRRVSLSMISLFGCCLEEVEGRVRCLRERGGGEFWRTGERRSLEEGISIIIYIYRLLQMSGKRRNNSTPKSEAMRPEGNQTIPGRRVHTPRKATHRYANTETPPSQEYRAPYQDTYSSQRSQTTSELRPRTKRACDLSPPRKKRRVIESEEEEEEEEEERRSVEKQGKEEEREEEEKEAVMRNLEPHSEEGQQQQQSQGGMRPSIKISEKLRLKYLVENNYNVYAHGPPCCGKTTLAREVLEEIGAAYRYIDCIILGEERYIVSSMVSFLRMYMLSGLTRSSGKFEQLV